MHAAIGANSSSCQTGMSCLTSPSTVGMMCAGPDLASWSAAPESTVAPDDTASEMVACTRALDDDETSSGGAPPFAAIVSFSAAVNLAAMDSCSMILSVAMQIWPDYILADAVTYNKTYI